MASPKRSNTAGKNPAPRTKSPEAARDTRHSSQGLAGAQGSGGGAERGVTNPPRRKPGGQSDDR